MFPELVPTSAAALEGVSDAARSRLQESVDSPGFEGVLKLSLVEELLRLDSRLTLADLMMRLIPLAAQFSVAPVSSYQVGVVCEGASGALYLGANLELRGQALGFTIHAEQSAVHNALVHGETGLRRLAVRAAPCGHCRQFLNEVVHGDEIVVLVPGRAPVTVGELLPVAFGPRDLGLQAGLLGRSPAAGSSDRLTAALAQSYAPYSKSPSAVLLRLADGAEVAGAYIENAAFNPSSSPLLNALDRLRFMPLVSRQVLEVRLGEPSGSLISQASYSRAIAESLGLPEVRVLHVPVTR